MVEPLAEQAAAAKSSLEHVNAKSLASDLAVQWGWVRQIESFTAGSLALREFVKPCREAVWSVTAGIRVRCCARSRGGSWPARHVCPSPEPVRRRALARPSTQAASSEVEHAWQTGLEPSETTKRAHASLPPARRRPRPILRAGYWATALDFRRQHPGLLVAFATGVSVLPAAYTFRESRLTAARLLARNSIVGCGTVAVLLYPELVFRTAPYVSRGVHKAEIAISSVSAASGVRGGGSGSSD